MFTELKDTAGMMVSEDYRLRFVSEYWQTKIRWEKLKDFCNKIEVGGIVGREPQHDCPLGMLRDQQRAMGEYLHILELRALVEGIDLKQEIGSVENTMKCVKRALNER